VEEDMVMQLEVITQRKPELEEQAKTANSWELVTFDTVHG
jgi:hypothetical protein